MHYLLADHVVRAVDGVSFDLARGEALGIVGESGCGKTSLAYTPLRLLPGNGRIVSGRMVFDGHDLVTMPDEAIRRVRWRRISMIFQHAMSALNPVFRVSDQLVDVVRLHEPVTVAAARARIGELFERVGIPASRMDSYPHEFSGGMRQRAIIAMSLICQPDLVIADEPTTALDVVAQAQVLNQLRALRREFNLSLILVTHDIMIVGELCDTVAVMYAGEIVEFGPVHEVFLRPRHPYTTALLRAFPPLRGEVVRVSGIPGSPPNLASPPAACRFAPRCPFAQPICREAAPHSVPVGSRHLSWCHFASSPGFRPPDGVREETRA